jgi:hypothetical protein
LFYKKNAESVERTSPIFFFGLDGGASCALARLEQGMRVLVNGASGGGGVFAVQVANVLAAHVTTTASAANLECAAGSAPMLRSTTAWPTRSRGRVAATWCLMCSGTAARPILPVTHGPNQP